MSLPHFPSLQLIATREFRDKNDMCQAWVKEHNALLEWKLEYERRLKEFFEWLDDHPCFMLIGQPERREYEEKKKGCWANDL